jgi:hypothetical protein
MITYKRNIDGLPGTTMPGVKGETGERGAMTYYSSDSSTKYDLTYEYSIGMISNNSSYEISYVLDNEKKSANSEVLSIHSNYVQPKLYDNILANGTDGTNQYQIVEVIDISYNDISIYNDDTSEEFAELDSKKVAFLNYLASTSSVKDLNNTTIKDVADKNLETAVSNTILDDIESATKNSDKPFTCYIVRLLDTWKYTNTKTDFDYEISVSEQPLEYLTWNGYYKKVDVSCCDTGHSCNTAIATGASIEDDYNTYYNSIVDKILKKVHAEEEKYRNEHGDIKSKEEYFEMADTILGKLFDPRKIKDATISDDTQVKYYLNAVSTRDIYGPSEYVEGAELCFVVCNCNLNACIGDGTRFDSSISIQETSAKFSLLYSEKTNQEGSSTTKLTVKQIYNKTADRITFVVFLLSKAVTGITPRSYSTLWIPYSSYYQVAEDNSLYMNYYTLLQDNDGNSFNWYDMIPVYMTNEIDCSTSEKYSILQITVKNTVDKSAAENYKIEIEFLKNTKKFSCNTQSVIPSLWKGVTNYERLNTSTAKGAIENYSMSLNFDDEIPNRFVYIVKNFSDDNNGLNIFKKNLYLPPEVLSNYTMHMYIYSKTSAASYNKIYLGEITI